MKEPWTPKNLPRKDLNLTHRQISICHAVYRAETFIFPAFRKLGLEMHFCSKEGVYIPYHSSEKMWDELNRHMQSNTGIITRWFEQGYSNYIEIQPFTVRKELKGEPRYNLPTRLQKEAEEDRKKVTFSFLDKIDLYFMVFMVNNLLYPAGPPRAFFGRFTDFEPLFELVAKDGRIKNRVQWKSVYTLQGYYKQLPEVAEAIKTILRNKR